MACADSNNVTRKLNSAHYANKLCICENRVK